VTLEEILADRQLLKKVQRCLRPEADQLSHVAEPAAHLLGETYHPLQSV
jgi:hypothetical protein